MAKRNAKGQFTTIRLRPLETIPSTPPTNGLRPAPDMPKPWKDKALISSRTIASIVLTILVFVAAKFFGVDIDLQAIGVGSDGGITVYEAILLAGTFLAGLFRYKATGPITGFRSTPD